MGGAYENILIYKIKTINDIPTCSRYFNEQISRALLIARVNSFTRGLFEYDFCQLTEDIDKNYKMSMERLIIGNYVILTTNQTIDYEFIIILECIVYQFHRSLAFTCYLA